MLIWFWACLFSPPPSKLCFLGVPPSQSYLPFLSKGFWWVEQWLPKLSMAQTSEPASVSPHMTERIQCVGAAECTNSSPWDQSGPRRSSWAQSKRLGPQKCLWSECCCWLWRWRNGTKEKGGHRSWERQRNRFSFKDTNMNTAPIPPGLVPLKTMLNF